MTDRGPDREAVGDDGLVWCSRCRRRVTPEAWRQHNHGVSSGVIRLMAEEEHDEWDREQQEGRAWWDRIF